MFIHDLFKNRRRYKAKSFWTSPEDITMWNHVELVINHHL